jgi:hypothetical protein
MDLPSSVNRTIEEVEALTGCPAIIAWPLAIVTIWGAAAISRSSRKNASAAPGRRFEKN